MAVFPENMDKLDLQDTVGSLRMLENYIRYMRERVEFSNQKMSRSVGSGGSASVEILELVLELTSAMSRMQSAMNEMGRSLNEFEKAMHVNEDGELVFTAKTQLALDCGEW